MEKKAERENLKDAQILKFHLSALTFAFHFLLSKFLLRPVNWPVVCLIVSVNVRFRSMQSPEPMKSSGGLIVRDGSFWCILLAGLMLAGFCMPGRAQITLNVKDYGAKGDAVQFYVNTVSNSVVVTTTNSFTSADIGKTLEIYDVGVQTYGVNSYGVRTNGNQDLIAVVTNVVAGTNLYLNVLSYPTITNPPTVQRTLTSAFATLGTDNTPVFSKTIAAAASETNATIYFPNGKYLCMPTRYFTTNGYGFVSIMLYRGGLHFVGESRDNTILLSRGAWQLPGHRSFLVEIAAPITNDFPIIFDNMTWDGGVQTGNLAVHGITVNKVDGLGWDEQHSAYLTYDRGNNSGTATHQILTNLNVVHWRGEMIKSIDGNRNGNIAIKNCLFGDGCATALNVYPRWDVRYNTFSNLFQVAELYQKYYTNTGYFCNNFVTNITANGFAINGGEWTSSPFIMESNVFYFNGVGNNGILTLPAANVSILNNEIHCANYMSVFTLGAIGSQGTQMNSNILIAGNSIYAPSKLTAIFGFGGAGVNGISGLTICSNFVSAPDQIFYVIQAGANQTNVSFFNNVIECPMVKWSTASGSGPFVLIQTNNPYTGWPTYLASVQTNTVSYGSGPKQRMDYVATGNAFVLQDSNPTQIPAGAYFEFDNRSNKWAAQNSLKGVGNGDVIIFPSEKLTSSLVLPFGQEMVFYWNGSAWMTNSLSSSSRPTPPWGLRPLTQTNSSTGQ